MTGLENRIIPGDWVEPVAYYAERHGVTLPDEIAVAISRYGRLCAAVARNQSQFHADRRDAAEGALCKAIALLLSSPSASPPDSATTGPR